MKFSDGFQRAFDAFHAAQEKLERHPVVVNISTASFMTTILQPEGDDTDLSQTLQSRACYTGDYEAPLVTKSSFTSNTLDILPFPTVRPSIHVRVFCSKRTALVTGAKNLVDCIAALDAVCTPHGLDITFPSCRLMNVNCTLGEPVSFGFAFGAFVDNPWVESVDKPERQNRLIVQFTNGAKMMLFSSGKFSLHGRDPGVLHETAHAVSAILQAM